MRVFLTSAYPPGAALEFLRQSAAADRFRAHEACSGPEGADAILLVENLQKSDPWWSRLRAHALVRSDSERVFMYNETDRPWCVLPGLYSSMPRRAFQPDRQAACGYFYRANALVSTLHREAATPDLLYSFLGAVNHPMRRRVLALRDDRALIEDTTAFSIWHTTDQAENERRRRRYADVLARSRFVLCPRGAGTSSYRLFESMEAGRAPVVLSDQWVPPEGPDWSFLVRVRERDVRQVPELLRRLEPEWADRGRAARAAWESWYAPEVTFHRAAEALDRLRARRTSHERWRRLLPDPEYFRVRAEQVARSAGRAVRDRLRGLSPRIAEARWPG